MRALLVILVLAAAAPLGAQAVRGNTYTYTCATSPKPKAGDTLIVRATGASTCVDTLHVRPSAPAPAPTPVPPGASDEPVFTADAGTLLFSENFERYIDIASMGAWPYQYPAPVIAPMPGPNTTGKPVSPGLQLLVPGRTGKAIRMVSSGVSQGGSDIATLELPATPATQTFYASMWVRVTLHGDFSRTSLAVKWLEAWHLTNGNSRTQWNTRYASEAYRPNEPQPTVWQVIDTRDAVTNGDQPRGPYFNQVADGTWHRFTYAYRSNSRAGARDGLQRMWIDGTLVIDVSARAIGVTPAGARHVWCTAADVDGLAVNDGIAFLRFGGTQTTTTPAWDYDVDDLVIWRGN